MDHRISLVMIYYCVVNRLPNRVSIAYSREALGRTSEAPSEEFSMYWLRALSIDSSLYGSATPQSIKTSVP